jgi:hypothetical protein
MRPERGISIGRKDPYMKLLHSVGDFLTQFLALFGRSEGGERGPGRVMGPLFMNLPGKPISTVYLGTCCLRLRMIRIASSHIHARDPLISCSADLGCFVDR